MRSRFIRVALVCAVFLSFLRTFPAADAAPQTLPFTQDWTNTALITADDNWSGVPGVVGYRGDGMAGTTGVDPQTVTADFAGAGGVIDVTANQTNPNTFTTGGVAEFQLANPVIAFQGSGTARAPNVVITVSTAGLQAINIAYNLRDVDGSTDNAVQPVALQYRVGTTGAYTNVPAGFIADATTGPSVATQVTPVSVALPAAVENQPIVQFRVITTDAVGSDEWVGIDDISVTGSTTPQPTNPSGLISIAPSTLFPGDTTRISVAVTPGTNPPSTGITVDADLSPMGGNSLQPLFDDGTHGDTAAGDNTFTVDAVVGVAAPGPAVITATVRDGQGRSSTTTAGVAIARPAARGVVISQVYGGGGNSGATITHDFIELHNLTSAAIPLAGWSVQYAGATGATWQVTPLTGTIPAHGYYLVQEAQGAGGTEALPAPDATGTIAMSGTSGKVALIDATAALSSCPALKAVSDLVGYGAANCFEGSAAAPTLSNTTAALRLGNGDVDTDDNAADFATGAPAPHNTLGIPPAGTGRAQPQAVDNGGSSLLTVSVTPGALPPSGTIVVTADLAAIGGAIVDLHDDATGGDAVAHDNVFSALVTVTGAPGLRALPVTISDDFARTAGTTIRLAINASVITPTYAVQGTGSTSPFDGAYVTTTGVVTALKFNGVFVQDAAGDGDAATSDGVLVFTGGAPPDFLSVGDSVVVSGTVQEFIPAADPASPSLTEIGNAAFAVIASGQPLPAPVLLLPSFTNPAGNFEQLERFEGMRIVTDLVAIAPTQAAFTDETHATSTTNGVFYGVINGVPRPMRTAGLEPEQVLPAGAPAGVPRFDGNPERLRVDSDALLGAQPLDVVAGQTFSAFTGVLDYAFRSYMILPDPPVVAGHAWEPVGSAAANPVPSVGPSEFTVSHFNLERFFDEVDDAAVSDVALDPAALDKRLAKASLAIRHVLKTPDILGVVEVENLRVLTMLAARISADALAAHEPDPQYAPYLEEGNDIGGIDVGFLVKQAGDRVRFRSIEQIGKDTPFTFGGDTAPLNDRPSYVLQADVVSPLQEVYPITVIVNHLRSLSGIDGSDGDRIRHKRQAQAEFLANYIQARQTANPAEWIVSVGDFNAFQFSDGYVDVMGTITGRPAPGTEVVLASPDLVNPDLTNLLERLPQEQRYSFSFDGNAQALDHVLVNAPMLRRFTRIAFARVDADFPEAFRGDGGRPERVSDHDAPVAFFAFPGAPSIQLQGPADMTVELGSSFTDPGAVAADLGNPLPVTTTVDPSTGVDVHVLGDYVITYSATNGFFDASVTRTVHVVDRTPPAIASVSATPDVLVLVDHKMADVFVNYQATDLAGAATCALTVSSNEPTNGIGDGNTSIDWHVLDAHHIQLRAERSGTGSGRVYSIAIRCTDPSRNASVATATVRVPK